MAKKRLNVTVDPDVKRQLDAREDINTSGLVNDFLKRYLRGETNEEAAERLRIERLKEEEKELRSEANSIKQQRRQIEEKLEEKREEKKEKVKTAANALSVTELKSADEPLITDGDERVRDLANRVGVSESELRERAKQQYKDSQDTGRSFQ